MLLNLKLLLYYSEFFRSPMFCNILCLLYEKLKDPQIQLVGCDSGSNDSSPGGSTSSNEEYKTYTAYDEDGNAFILVITENNTYVFSIQNENGTSQESSTGTVTSSNNTSFTLKNKGGNIFIVTININVIVSIPLDNGGTKSPQGEIVPE